jgi:phosphopantothenoylcysteine decarboxylase/phosphopantothenate--cysteine ligase
MDMIVANDVTAPGAGFDVQTNRVTLIDVIGRETDLPLMSKRDVAAAILDRAGQLMASRESQ